MGNPGGGSKAYILCLVCGEEGDCAHGSAYNLLWLCSKHDKELKKEEKKLKAMIEMQALTNIKKRFLEEKYRREP